MRRPLTATTVTLALLGASFTVPASGTAPRDDRVAAGEQRVTAKSKTKRSPGIVSPKPNQTVRRHTTTVTVRAPHGVRTAQLNSTRLRGEEFTLHADGVRRSVKISSSHGLRHGRNTLRVTIDKRYKGTVTRTVRFTVKGKPLLTGAGRDRRAVAGSGVTLRGTVRLHPSMRDRDTTTTWRIAGKPAGSKPVLLRAKGKKPRLKTDLPGRYVVRATSSFGRGAASRKAVTSDTVTVTAPEAPMVPFNGFSTDGAGVPGISVGGRFYPTSLPLQLAAWQMLVLDRKTLGVAPGGNRTYGDCPGGTCVARDGGGTPTLANAAGDFEKLGTDDLVVLVHHPKFGGDVITTNAMADDFGLPSSIWTRSGDAAAAVLVPGDSGGAHTIVRDSPARADLSGTMMMDRFLNYTFVDDARVPFDTRSSQTCDATSCTVKVTVGEVTRQFTANRGESGLAVTRFDRRTLAFRDSQFVLTGGVSPDNIRDNLVGASNYLKSLPKDDLVVITSVAVPGKALIGKPSPVVRPGADGESFQVLSDPATDLGTQIARLGGSRHRILQAAVAPGDGYTLVGYPGLEEGQGNESHTEGARLSGVLQRDNRQMFVPRTVVPGPERYDAFTATVLDAPNRRAWPGEDDPAFMTVLRCLAKANPGMNTVNPRVSYWSSDVTVTTTQWSSWYQAVRKAQPSDCPGTDTAKFTQARDQFAKELRFNFYLRSYIDSLKAPYGTKAAVTSLADVSKWSSELKASSDEIKSKGVSVDWFAVLATVVEAVAPFLAGALESKTGKKLVEEATHALSAAIAGAIETGGASLETEESGEKYLQDDEFNAEVGQLGSELVGRMLNTADNLDSMGDVVASDYAKLSAVGRARITCQQDADANRRPGDPGFTCDPSYFTSKEVVDKAKVSASHAAERTIYETVLPLTYPVTSLPWDGKITQGDGVPEGNWNATLFTCFNATPFPDEWPDAAKPFLRRSVGTVHKDGFMYFAGFDGADVRTGYTTPQFDTYVIAAFGKDRFNVETADQTVKRMFGKSVDSTDPKDGGLGADPVAFVLQQLAEGKVKDYPLGCGGFSDTNNVPAPLER